MNLATADTASGNIRRWNRCGTDREQGDRGTGGKGGGRGQGGQADGLLMHLAWGHACPGGGGGRT
jgi:hypothetical protein